jgi:peptide/nickel transport system permease protein
MAGIHAGIWPLTRPGTRAQWLAGKILARLAQALLTMLGASVLVWLLFAYAPGDPAQRALAARGILAPTASELAGMQHTLGLDRPAPVRYLSWLGNALHGNLGRSYITQLPVTTELATRLGPTLRLAFMGLLFMILLSGFLGMLAAFAANRAPDLAIRGVTVICAATPSFIAGLFIIQFVVIRLGIGQALGNGGWGDAILPGLALGLATLAVPARVFRQSLIDGLGSYYALVAHSRGSSKLRILLRHAVPNAITPFTHAIAVAAASLIGGTVIVEAVFNWPGMGSYLIQAVEARDLPVVQAITLLATASYILASLAADLVSLAFDSHTRGRS